MSEVDPLSIRVGDADRERVAEALRDAAATGRIDADELDERLAATFAARTVGDLAPLTADLPAGRVSTSPSTSPSTSLDEQGARLDRRPGGVPSRVVAGPDRTRHIAIMGGLERKGDWVVPAEMSILCFWGGADLDLREARFAAPEVVITINAIMGGASITVDEDTEVVMEGVGIMGGYSGPSSIVPAADDAVTVRVRGVAIMGGVSVERKPADRDLPGDGGRRRKRLH